MNFLSNLGNSLLVKILYIALGLFLGFDWKAVLVLPLERCN